MLIHQCYQIKSKAKNSIEKWQESKKLSYETRSAGDLLAVLAPHQSLQEINGGAQRNWEFLFYIELCDNRKHISACADCNCNHGVSARAA